MSRTYKHTKQAKQKRSYKVRQDLLYETIPYEYRWLSLCGSYLSFVTYISLEKPGVLIKKPKRTDTETHWMSTPSNWTRIMMNRPQRREGALWETEVLKISVANLEEVDKPSVSRKPHVYYW